MRIQRIQIFEIINFPPARHGLATHAEKADTLAVLPVDKKGKKQKGVFLMRKQIKIYEPMICVDKLYERWTGIHGHEGELASLIDAGRYAVSEDGIPTPYFVHKVLQTDDNKFINICSKCFDGILMQNYRPYRVESFGDEASYYFDNIAYIMSEILEYEKTRPELFYKVVDDPDAVWKAATLQKEVTSLHPGLQILSAYDVIADLGITPIELVDMLNGSSVYDENNKYIGTKRLVTIDEGNFREYSLSDPYFRESDIKNVGIYKRDFDLFCQAWGIEQSIRPNPVNNSEPDSSVAEVQKRIESLSEWNKRLNENNHKILADSAEKDTRIAELEAELTALQMNRKDMQSDNRTDAATNARLRKIIQEWKDSLPAMVKVALQCGEKGEKERTENEIKAMFEKNGDIITQTQLIEFKKALGPKHAKHSAGAPKQ